MRKIGYDHLAADAVQIVEDSKCCLKVNAIITKVGVYEYPDGRAFKSPMELLKATRTARAAKLMVLDHPPDPMPVVMSQGQMKGNVEKPFFDRDKMRAVLNFDKHENDPAFLEGVRAAASQTGKPLDVSIGFYYKQDNTPGQWKDIKGVEHPYDYVMRDMVIDHVACGVPRGRCSFPDCGIGVDTLMSGHLKIDYDTMEECIADNGDKEDPAGFCAWLLRQTGKCTQSQIDAYMKRLKEKTKKMSEDPKEAFIKAKEAEGVSREEAEAQYAELTNAPPAPKGQPGAPSTPGIPEPHIPEKLDAPYPWDQCISDQLAAGYTQDQADKICASIKNRTVSHASQFYGIKNLKKAAMFVLKKAETDKLFQYNLDKSVATFKAEAKTAKGEKDAELEAKFCAMCGTALVENKCPKEDCTVFGKLAEASSDAAHAVDATPALKTDELVERSKTLISMKAEADTQKRIDSAKRR